jgi:amino acid efflux transporter
MNAYSIGVSRLVYALARDRSMPSVLYKLNKQAAPARALVILFVGSAISLCIDALFSAKLDELFLISGAGFTSLYILSSASAVKLLRLHGLERVFPYVTLLVSITVFIFVRQYALFPITILILALAWIRLSCSYRKP